MISVVEPQQVNRFLSIALLVRLGIVLRREMIIMVVVHLGELRTIILKRGRGRKTLSERTIEEI